MVAGKLFEEIFTEMRLLWVGSMRIVNGLIGCCRERKWKSFITPMIFPSRPHCLNRFPIACSGVVYPNILTAASLSTIAFVVSVANSLEKGLPATIFILYKGI